MWKTPEGYSIGNDKHNKLIVLHNGERINRSWFREELDAVRAAWEDYYYQLAVERNAEREDERTHILAWRNKSTGLVYSLYVLSHFIPAPFLEEITVATHGKEIVGMRCACCGISAVDDDVLEKFGLLERE